MPTKALLAIYTKVSPGVQLSNRFDSQLTTSAQCAFPELRRLETWFGDEA